MITITDDSQITKNFSAKEVASRGVLMMNDDIREFMDMAQELRNVAALTYVLHNKNGLITSCIQRQPQHNKDVGGASNSCHLDGLAMDVININMSIESHIQFFITAWRVICSIHGKIGGVEIGTNYMHFDNHSDKFGYTEFRLVDNR